MCVRVSVFVHGYNSGRNSSLRVRACEPAVGIVERERSSNYFIGKFIYLQIIEMQTNNQIK